MFSLKAEPIHRDEEIQKLVNDKAGALVVFEGWVRNHNEGKHVSSLEYQVYEALALKEGEKILQEAKHKFNLHHIVCVHRYGHLKLGEAAVWIGATATHRDDAYRASRYVIDEIKLRLPIWKKEHYVSEEPRWVFCKDHHTHVHFHEEDYYKKQEKLVSQVDLKNAHVLVVGAGGLGCPALTALTMAGVGHIDIVEFDKVSISNIHRQPLYSPDVVGEKKVTIAKNKLASLNPFIHVHGHDARISVDNAERFIGGKTLVLDCTDNLETKFLIHDVCMKLRVPLISASIYQNEGQIRTFIPGETGCLRCTYEKTPDDSKLGNCNDFGVIGASVAMLGNLEALEAIQYLSFKQNNTSTHTVFFNLKTLSQMKIKNTKRNDCEVCEGKVEIIKSDIEIDASALHFMDVILVDVRNTDDLSAYKQSEKPVVLYCHRGIKSKRLVENMRLQGYTNLFSLRGGACSL